MGCIIVNIRNENEREYEYRTELTISNPKKLTISDPDAEVVTEL